MTRVLRSLLAAAMLLGPSAAFTKVVATASSPDKSITVTLSIEGGRPFYAVSRNGRPIVAPSRLGFYLTDAAELDGDMALIDSKTSHDVSSWTQPWGEWQTIKDDHVELVARLQEQHGLRREMDVVFRLFDDGVGFRYVLPKQPNITTMRIAQELTEFNFVHPGTAWWIPSGGQLNYEYLYRKTPLSELTDVNTPLTVKFDDGTYMALHEAALIDYASMRIHRTEGLDFAASLAPSASSAAPVVREAPFATPWRTMILTDNAPGLYMSHIELNLNAPNALGDVSWLHPSKFVGIWWNILTRHWTWEEGPNHGATTAHARQYIDFAAKNGIRGVLAEGWNPGWDKGGAAFDFTRATPDFDIDALSRDAGSKGVHLVGHHETGGFASHYEDQLDAAFAFAAAHGEEVIKTGYATHANEIVRVDPDGQQYREWHDGQWMVNHYLHVVQTAAKYHLAIDSHEPIKDTGLRRTWPNWFSREGARGMEYNVWDGKNPPSHVPTLVFTRMLGGPMDFTPGIVSLTGGDGSALPSTLARQLALYIVLYSPVAMAADTPEAYERNAKAFTFIKQVPTDWADTRVLNGEVGEYVTMARKDRNSKDWYIGAVTDTTARALTVELDFLDTGKTYRADIYQDGPGADYRTDMRHAMTIEHRTVKAGDTLTLNLAPGGGEAIRLVPTA